MPFTKTQIAVGVAAIVAFMIVSAIQQHFMQVPVIGRYLPGGRMAA